MAMYGYVRLCRAMYGYVGLCRATMHGRHGMHVGVAWQVWHGRHGKHGLCMAYCALFFSLIHCP